MVDIAMLDPEKAAQIRLPQGGIALVDQEDLLRTLPYSWCATQTSRKTGKPKIYVMGYLIGSWRKRPGPVYLHRLVMDAPKGVNVDHRNGNTLDCRKSNLRLANDNQNAHNRTPNYTYGGKPCASRFKGVFYEKRTGKWFSKIGYLSVQRQIGTFEDEISAAEAYDDFSYWLHGEFGFRNFPDRPIGELEEAPILTQKCVENMRSVQSFRITDIRRKLEQK